MAALGIRIRIGVPYSNDERRMKETRGQLTFDNNCFFIAGVICDKFMYAFLIFLGSKIPENNNPPICKLNEGKNVVWSWPQP